MFEQIKRLLFKISFVHLRKVVTDLHTGSSQMDRLRNTVSDETFFTVPNCVTSQFQENENVDSVL